MEEKGVDWPEGTRFICETHVDKKALAVLARAMRKTVRRQQSTRMHWIGWALVLLAISMLVPTETRPFTWGLRTITAMIAGILIAVTLLFEDQMDGCFAWHRRKPGTENCVMAFREDGFSSKVSTEKSEVQYSSIVQLAETNDYFIFIYPQKRGQLCAKVGLSGGTSDEFRAFLKEKTKQPVHRI